MYCHYDKEMLHSQLKNNNSFIGGTIYRNNHYLGYFCLPDILITSAKGSAEMYHKMYGVRCELSYCPLSSQDNKQDIIMGIQTVKKRFDPNSLPKILLD